MGTVDLTINKESKLKIKILKKEMKLFGYTNRALAKKLGADPASIAAWLNDDYKPSAKYVKQMKDIGFSDAACFDPTRMVEV